MLDKLGGVFAPRPSCDPHKLRECLPLAIFPRNRLKYALTYDEVKKIFHQRLVKIDGKVRTDETYPASFMDANTIERTNENFRPIYDVKGRFAVHHITDPRIRFWVISDVNRSHPELRLHWTVTGSCSMIPILTSFAVGRTTPACIHIATLGCVVILLCRFHFPFFGLFLTNIILSSFRCIPEP